MTTVLDRVCFSTPGWGTKMSGSGILQQILALRSVLRVESAAGTCKLMSRMQSSRTTKGPRPQTCQALLQFLAGEGRFLKLPSCWWHSWLLCSILAKL